MGYFGWRFTLTEEGGPKNISYQLIYDPENPNNWKELKSQASHFSIEYIMQSTNQNLEATKVGFAAFLKHSHNKSIQKLIDDSYNEALVKFNFKEEQTLNVDQINDFQKFITYRLVHSLAKLPYTMQLNSEFFPPKLENKTPK